MTALTAIGEVGIEVGGRSYLLRPSLFSVSQIGTPTEIVEATAILLAPEPEDPFLLKRFRRTRFEQALTVLHACAGDDDLTDLIGGMVVTPGRRIAYSPGLMPLSDIVAIAQGLIRHGVLGDVEAVPERGTGEYLSEFKAEEYVSAAIAHLGFSEAEAWRLTMTSFIRVMRAKYPPQKNAAPRPHTATEYDATMAKLEKINAMRRAGKK